MKRTFQEELMHEYEINMLEDTLNIVRNGGYFLNGARIPLKHTVQELEKAEVFLPDEVEEIGRRADVPGVHGAGSCEYSCVNMDSYTLARKRHQENSAMFNEASKPVLVLNLANPVHPGGGVRRGTRAQEEDLCRKSSLLVSLESEAARRYYEYNKSLNTYMGSDAIILSPAVEIVKDENGSLLDEPVTVAVLTCAAPKITNGLEGMTERQYRDMFHHRICSMLKFAACRGYRDLVLGAWGCGAFGNDARLVSDLFRGALKELRLGGLTESDLFRRIDFAVLCRRDDYNYQQFLRNFGHFSREEDPAETRRAPDGVRRPENRPDAIRGCLVGGAAGDALGYSVEFMGEPRIFAQYGPDGIQAYQPDPSSGKALISDDTQMTLFTANDILLGQTEAVLRGTDGAPSLYMERCYVEWYKTQMMSFGDCQEEKRRRNDDYLTWLTDVPELFHRRAPGNTCMSALHDILRGQPVYNNSKGCGGVMRVAPLGLAYPEKGPGFAAEEAAKMAEVTHQHQLGYMPAAMLADLIHRIVFLRRERSLKELVIESGNAMAALYRDKPCVGKMLEITNLAVELAENDQPDLENIHRLGEGWVAEETLAIAVYCALRHPDDFSAGITAAVNHKGDSDSTGAVAGNILGAWLGFDAIDEKWKNDLELYPVILEMADDLCRGCPPDQQSLDRDADWTGKYVHAAWRQKQPPVFFWHEYEEYGEFSNWYPARFVIDDFVYEHTEQYMMAQKAKLFHDAERYTAILRETSPAECKRLGREVRPFDPETWHAAACEIVKQGIREKLIQNPRLLKLLLSTGDRTIAEASPYDSIWGIGMDAGAAASVPEKEWPGGNLLGKVLMELRKEFLSGVK